MIVFDLQCEPLGHRFEGWFASSADYEDQCARGLVQCPSCGAGQVTKAVMAPNIGRKGNQMSAPLAKAEAVPAAMANPPMPPLPPEAVAMLKAVATMQAEAIKSSTWVGDKFADDARAMHYGEKDAVPIHGKATPEQARDLIDEGVAVMPLLVPVVPPEEAN